MISDKENTRISKFLSLVLRHQPEKIGLELDSNGWADVDSLLQKCNQANILLTPEILKYIVATNSKNRFAFNENQNKIRASQGHSIDVELGLNAIEPPPILYHGTAEKFADSIMKVGLSRQSRQHVHLSSTVETAIIVGQRHGKPIVFEIMAQQMFIDKHEFFLSANGVWLTEYVPPEYLKEYHEKF